MVLTNMTLELVRNLKTYEINMKDLKKVKFNKEKSLALKASDGEESELDGTQVIFLAKNFKKLFRKRKRSDKKEQVARSGSMNNHRMDATNMTRLIT